MTVTKSFVAVFFISFFCVDNYVLKKFDLAPKSMDFRCILLRVEFALVP